MCCDGFTSQKATYCVSCVLLLRGHVCSAAHPGSVEKNFVWSGQCQINSALMSTVLTLG